MQICLNLRYAGDLDLVLNMKGLLILEVMYLIKEKNENSIWNEDANKTNVFSVLNELKEN
jgi:glycopeptide antibiotics resistance protein